MSDIRLEQASHSYRAGEQEPPRWALRDVSLEIREGEFVAVLGRNGSGKSTLARHLNALLRPTRGTVWVGDLTTAEGGNALRIRQKVGMVFQNPDNQIIANVVEEDVGFGPENLGVETESIWRRVEESLRSVGMEEYRSHSPNHLSGGQKQRVAIAGVLAMHPECIVMDESTAMLDPAGRREVLATAERLNREEGMTVILITHFMEEVAGADRVYVMDRGEVRMQGSPAEIFARKEELRACGLRPPQITELAAQLREAGLPLAEGILTEDELVEALCRLQ